MKKQDHSFLSRGITQVTGSSAVACFEYIGRGSRNEADQAAVNAMRKAFQKIPFKGKIVIGEGERDSAPMLYIGEKVGMWEDHHPEWDIAVDPLEGTNLCAKALGGALSVLALSERGGLFNAPDVYMEKIACGPAGKGVIDLTLSAEENIEKISQALNKNIRDMVVAVLDRPRHKELIKSIYKSGARVQLIEDGDLSASILTAWNKEPGGICVDMMMGTGGAPEGVLSAGALKCLGGDFQGRLVFQNEEEKKRAINMGVEPVDKIYTIEELVKFPVVFCATGVTGGALLKGVVKTHQAMETESLYMNSETGECSKIHESYTDLGFS
ncbi:MAG: class II fructose-bisphosphatase [Bdellovibrionales bacterium]|nr:class II fructose-bisphosphatase [Bdellovibrionales bacterium]